MKLIIYNNRNINIEIIKKSGSNITEDEGAERRYAETGDY